MEGSGIGERSPGGKQIKFISGLSDPMSLSLQKGRVCPRWSHFAVSWLYSRFFDIPDPNIRLQAVFVTSVGVSCLLSLMLKLRAPRNLNRFSLPVECQGLFRLNPFLRFSFLARSWSDIPITWFSSFTVLKSLSLAKRPYSASATWLCSLTRGTISYLNSEGGVRQQTTYQRLWSLRAGS